ncbi:MAG TPA: type II toxin-antitoxin system RelE/ParE family toxin [Acidiferrobacteraceae bacterium]|nr:type II toxin-antitoxin system RelE/ParE family toxin [Acidiferrobacteraceae bacterium]
MTWRFHPEARTEFLAAIEWYEEQQPNLGKQFAEEVFAAIDRIIAFPKSGSRLSPNTRRTLTRRFPYGVIYQSEIEDIHILAVTPLARRPGYWRERL